MLVYESLWNRYRPGCDPIGMHIRHRQWTAIHLTPSQQSSGVIPLIHVARVLTFNRPEGPTQVHSAGQAWHGERVGHWLIVPPTILRSPVIQLRHSPNGFLLSHEPPNLTATTHMCSALAAAGWDAHADPIDPEGRHILPALLRATKRYPGLRSQPTLPLAFMQRLMSYQPESTAGSLNPWQNPVIWKNPILQQDPEAPQRPAAQADSTLTPQPLRLPLMD